MMMIDKGQKVEGREVTMRNMLVVLSCCFLGSCAAPMALGMLTEAGYLGTSQATNLYATTSNKTKADKDAAAKYCAEGHPEIASKVYGIDCAPTVAQAQKILDK
jgi:hypothetical protein